MYALSGSDLIHIWEVGLRQHPIDLALTLLATAFPGQSRQKLALLSIGQRDSHLLTLREHMFGSHLQALAECPACTERLELNMRTTDIRVTPETDGLDQPLELVMDSCSLQFRLPNSTDLAAIVRCDDADQARQLLAQRCVLQVRQNDDVVSLEALPEDYVDKLAAQLTTHDPQAEVLLNLECPACENPWQMHFDIVSFLWKEISAQAKRLLREVHTLARFYGWREADILSLTPTRRQFYLEMAT